MRSGGEGKWQGVPDDAPFRHFTPAPDCLFDRLLGNVSPAEWEVICYIVRQTYGWKAPAHAVSIRALARALKRSTSTIRQAVARLEQRGVLLVERSRGEDGTPAVNVYRLRRQSDP